MKDVGPAAVQTLPSTVTAMWRGPVVSHPPLSLQAVAPPQCSPCGVVECALRRSLPPMQVRADYMDELCALQDRVPPFENDIAMAAIRGGRLTERRLVGH